MLVFFLSQKVTILDYLCSLWIDFAGKLIRTSSPLRLISSNLIGARSANRPGGEGYPGETFRDVVVPVANAAPGPGRAHNPVPHREFFEPPEKDSPLIPILRGKASVACQVFHPFPGKGDLHGPSLVDIPVIVQGSFDTDPGF